MDAMADAARAARPSRAAESQLAGRGRVLLRPSGTEPVIRVMVEGEDAAQVKSLAGALPNHRGSAQSGLRVAGRG